MADTCTQQLRERSASRIYAIVTLCAAILLSPLLLAGCAAQSPMSDDDQRVISQLAEIAPQDSEIEGETTGVECWKPSENKLDGEAFRVICRIHYEQGGTDRYRDMICIGDLSQEPVTDHCYRWAFYTDMPSFEDNPGYSSS